MPDTGSNPPARSRRWTIIAAGLLLLPLALVVIYTSRAAFFSPLALVVVAAIGMAALLLRLRLGQRSEGTGDGTRVRAPLWSNILGLIFVVGAVFADLLQWKAPLIRVAALVAVICFAVSGVTVLHALRKKSA